MRLIDVWLTVSKLNRGSSNRRPTKNADRVVVVRIHIPAIAIVCDSADALHAGVPVSPGLQPTLPPVHVVRQVEIPPVEIPRVAADTINPVAVAPKFRIQVLPVRGVPTRRRAAGPR